MEENMKFIKLLKSLWKYMKQDKAKIILAVSLIVICSLLNLTYGYFNGAAVQAITDLNLKLFLLFMGLYFSVQLFGNQILRKQSKLLLNKIQLNLTQKISFELFKKTGKLPAKAFEEKSSGEMINRVTSDAETITDMLNQLLLMSIELFGTFLVLFYVFYNSWIVGLEIIVYIGLIALLTKHYAPKMKEYQKDIKERTDGYIAEVNQNVLGIREIRALGIRKRINENIEKIIDGVFQKRRHLLDYETKYKTLVQSLNVVLEVGVFITCAILIILKHSNLTFFIAMTYYVYRYMHVVESLSSFMTIYQKVVVAMDRISQILDNTLYEDQTYGTISVEQIDGNLKFDDVTFGYDKDSTLLRNFQVEFKTGKKIAIVGKSGQGKTTLFNLLLRYFEPSSGMIYIDSYKLHELDEQSLRKHISVIRQDPFLFNKTIKENFDIVNPSMTFDQMRQYCETAKIDEYIMSLPKGYDTKIGEGGVNLSGGQKQRIAIARTLMKNSKVILFDEATSALDNQSQASIKTAIDKIALDHTVIMVAHRLSTIVDADEIYVIDKGQVIGRGTHNELMISCSIYKGLYGEEIVE